MLPEEQFLAWGWRLPFLFSIVLVAIGLFIRLKVLETPAFSRVKETHTEARMPIVEVLRTNPGRLFLAAGISFGFTSILYVTIVFLLSYGTAQLGLPREPFLVGTIIAALVSAVATVALCALSDLIGRRPVIIGGGLFLAAFSFPFFWLINTGSSVLIWLAMTVALTAGQAIYGPLAALISELFGTRTRYSGASLGYQMGATVGGGFSPLIALSLLAWSGGASWSVSLYLLLVCLVAAVSTYLLTETARSEISEDQPVRSGLVTEGGS
jgi:MFS family permease